MENKNRYLRLFSLIYSSYIPVAIIFTWNSVAMFALIYIIPITFVFSGIIYYISGLKNNKTINIIYCGLMSIMTFFFGVFFYSKSIKELIVMLSVIAISSVLSKVIVYCCKKRDSIISFWGLNFNLFLILFPTVGIILENFD